MKEPTRREVAIVFVCALIIVVLLLAQSCGPVSRSTDAPGDGSIGSSPTFTIRGGTVSGALAPGMLVALDLTLANTNDRDLDIDKITVVVVSIDAPLADADHPCNGADFEVRQLSSGVVLKIARNSSQSLSGLDLPQEKWPAVGMINHPVNQDGCKGASLTLRYLASGVEVPR